MTLLHSDEGQQIPFKGRAQLIANLQPWRLAFEVEGIEISLDNFICRIPRNPGQDGFTIEELSTFLEQQPALTLQLHFSEEDLPIILPGSFLHGCNIDALGVTLNIALTGKKSELESIILATQTI